MSESPPTTPAPLSPEDPASAPRSAQDLFVAIAAIAIWFACGLPIPYISVIGAICTLAGGYPIFHEAYENIVQRRMTMELSMAIAIVAALAIRETFTALVITLFVLAAEILEGLTVGRGRNAIQRLLDLLPNQTTPLATVLLPSSAWCEKRGSMINLKGRLQRLNRAVSAPKNRGHDRP